MAGVEVGVQYQSNNLQKQVAALRARIAYLRAGCKWWISRRSIPYLSPLLAGGADLFLFWLLLLPCMSIVLKMVYL